MNEPQAPPFPIIGTLRKLDEEWSGRIHSGVPGVIADAFFVLPALLFGRFGYPFVSAAVWLAFGWPVLRVQIMCSFVTALTTESLKWVLQRPRPAPHTIGHRTWNIRGTVTNPAFPSGDSAQAAMICALLAHVTGQSWPLAMIPFTMMGRVYFGPHWIGDTIAGAGIGLYMSSVFCRTYL